MPSSSTARPLTEHAAYDATQFVDVAEAARRLGKSAGHIRRMCAGKWSTAQLAVNTVDGWKISIDADPALADAGPGSSTPHLMIRDDFKALPPTQQTAAMHRSECVRRFRHAKLTLPGAVKTWLPGLLAELDKAYPELKISRTSLYRWDKQAGHPIDVAELVDWRGWANSEQGGAGSPEAWKYFSSQYLDGNQPSIKDCWERTALWAAERGYDWCSASSCRRQLDQRIPVDTQLKHRDPAAWRSKCATFIQQHPERHAAGECWVSDHRPLDIRCRFEGKIVRPQITIWQDWRTRKIVSWELSVKPNADTILAAFAGAVRDPSNLGPPKIALMDNGKDFDSRALHGRSKKERQAAKRANRDRETDVNEKWFGGVFGALGVEAIFSLPHNPQGKGRCERWFATMAVQFDKKWETYTGKDTTRKPEDLADRMDKRPGIVPTFAQIREAVGEFVTAYNANADHQMEDLRDPQTQAKLSPSDAYAAWTTPRVMADSSALDLCLMAHTKELKVRRHRVRVTLPGCPTRYYGEGAPELLEYNGTDRLVRVTYDPGDLRTVYIRDAKTLRLVCVAAVNSDTGVHGSPESREAHKRAMKRKRDHAKKKKALNQDWAAGVMPDDMLIAEEADKLAAGDSPEPTTLKFPDPDGGGSNVRVVQTPFDDESKDIRKLKVAGGDGDCDDMPDPLTGGLPSLEQLRQTHQATVDVDDGWDVGDLDVRQLKSPGDEQEVDW